MKRFLPILITVSLFTACNSNETIKTPAAKTDSLTETERHQPENALKGLTIADGLAITTFATEPMLQNPTNIDVDERGRVWVCEAYNYRPAINGNPTNALGDRIMILEDTNGDGKADTAKVFYQGPELNAPLGICVLGHRVIVSQSPYVWSFYDDNGDDKADRKEIMFEGISGEQHDHGIHAFTFGPDGKLYFNAGNEGKQLKDKNGQPVRDQDGDIIDQKKYKQGMVFRCDTNGAHVEVLGQNFRNPYEVAVDSYGSLWQSDNDDDGNRGVRLNYVEQYGNYGYTDEMTGAGWQASRTNMEDSIPLRHWHLNDPGEVPNLLQTYAGSPTGMAIYEGSLLPAFKGQMIHCDAGPNVVRSYPVKKDGAGYTATIQNMVNGDKDRWFRPADICVAPDGSMIIADWYDPGVGGHQAGDQTKGRIYRLAPPGVKYSIPVQDYSTAEAAVLALQNPNLAVRHHAFTTLQLMGAKAIPALDKLWLTGTDSRMRARALWLLAQMPGGDKYIQSAIKDKDADLRITALRAACEAHASLPVIKQLVNDPDAQVRRECAIALHHLHAPEAASLWATLANQYDGHDRWYLEALGIGADKQWDAFYAAWSAPNASSSPAINDIVWRARTDKSIPALAALAADSSVALKSRLRYFRAFDFNTGTIKGKYLLAMLGKDPVRDTALNKLVLHHLDIPTVSHNAAAMAALKAVLQSVSGKAEFVELVNRYQLKSENKNLLDMAIANPDKGLGRNAASSLLQLGGEPLVWSVLKGKDEAQQEKLLSSLGGVGSKTSLGIIEKVAFSETYPLALRKKAAEKIGRSGSGEDRVLVLLKSKKVPAELIPLVVSSVEGAWRTAIKKEAATYLPPSMNSTASKKEPTMNDLAALKGNALAGKELFTNRCATCHQVNGSGYDFGPKLSEIGSKLPKEAILDAILHPSAGIAFGYEGYMLKMKDGSMLTGLISSKTETDIDLKLPGGGHQQIKTSAIATMTEMKPSMMPEGLVEGMSNQDLANLLEFLEELKKR